ncbi:MAG TPA: hypothetical protein VN862_08750 [Candidatus Acidoferrales bacterium]|nr:hypothetical protein [Candidatus Acidoferrales bacterium]
MPLIRIVGERAVRKPLGIVPFPSAVLDIAAVQKSLPELQRQISKRHLGVIVEICYTRRNPFGTSDVVHLVAVGIAILGPEAKTREGQSDGDLRTWLELKLKTLFGKRRGRIAPRSTR